MNIEEVELLHSKKDGDDQLNDERWIDRLFPAIGFLEDPSDPSFDIKDKQDVIERRRDEKFMMNLSRGMEIVKSFYGLETNAFGLLQVGPSTQQERRFNLYFKNNNGEKNYRRITRILFCLGIFGQGKEFSRWKIALITLLFASGRTAKEPPGKGNLEYPYLALWRMARCFSNETSLDALVFSEKELVDLSTKFSSIRDFRFAVKDNKGDEFQVVLDDRESFLIVSRKIHPYDKPIEFFAFSKESNQVIDLGSLYWHVVFEPADWSFDGDASFFLILLPDFKILTKASNSPDGRLYLSQNLALKLSMDEKGDPIFLDKGIVILPKQKKGVVVPKIKIPPMFVYPNPVGGQTTSTRQIVSLPVPLY